MLKSTKQVISAATKADPSMSTAERAKLLTLLRTGDDQAAPTEDSPKLLRRQKAAERLGCCLRTIDNLARQGVLRKRVFPGRKRAAGFLEADITALVKGADHE